MTMRCVHEYSFIYVQKSNIYYKKSDSVLFGISFYKYLLSREYLIIAVV